MVKKTSMMENGLPVELGPLTTTETEGKGGNQKHRKGMINQ